MAKYVADSETGYEADTDNIIQALAGNGIVGSGFAVTAQGSPNMTVAVASGSLQYDGVITAVGATASLAIAAADATNARRDLVHVTSAGVVAVVTGTPAATPKPPALPTTSILLAYVSVPAAATNIQNSNITNRRIPVTSLALATTTSKGFMSADDKKALTTQTATGGTVTVDFASGLNYRLTSNANVNITLSNGVAGQWHSILIHYGGAHTVTFVTSVQWPGGTTPTWTSTNAKTDIVVLFYTGSTWYATATLNFTS